MQNVFILGLKDFLTKKFLALTLLPFIISFLFFGTLYTVLDIHINFSHLTGIGFIDSIIATVASFLAGLLGWVAIFAIATIFATVIMGFFTPIVVKEIHKRHYPDIELEGGVGIVDYLILLIKSFIKFIGVFIISVIFYFLPLLNYIAFHIPFYYLFSTLLSLDVGGEIFTKRELEEVLKKERTKIYSTTAILYLITLIPFTGMFLQVYFVSVMAHLFFKIKAKRRHL